MAYRILALPRLALSGSSSAIFALTIVVMLWAGLGFKFIGDRRADGESAERTARNYAMIFEENVLRSIGEIDKSLLYMRRTLEAREPGADLSAIVNTTDVLSEIIVQMAVIDRAGTLRASNAGPQPAVPTDLSDREHFRVHVGNPRDEVFISKPVIGRTSKRWSVQFSRRLLTRGGVFDGVVVASLDPNHFTKFYNSIDFGSLASIALIGQDGVVRSRGGAESLTLGQDLSRTDIMDFIKSGRRESLLCEDGPNGRTLMAIRQVRDHPLWVSVGFNEADIFRSSWTNLAVGSALAALATVLLLIGAERILRSEGKRSEVEADLARLAAEDPLTGLPNRRLFRSVLETHLAPRSDGNVAIAGVMFLDLDRFKLVNDTLGHRIGDLLLKGVAERLTRELGGLGLLARLGGDEFAVLLRHTDDAAVLGAVADRLVRALEPPFAIDGHQIRSGASIGVARAPEDGRDADTILISADTALYAVKASSRGRHQFFDRSMTERASERRLLEADLRAAVARHGLHLEYQPLIDAQSGRIASFEALARWHDPVRGIVPPAVFIAVAEDCGLIQEIGEWALREACREACTWPGALRVAVNLSPLQLSGTDIFDVVDSALREAGLPAERLELEITESLLLEQTDGTLGVLRSLRALGVRIALDDFGTGYSSISYLRRFPFDKIKIDRSFVNDLGLLAENATIIKAVVDVARALGMSVTAEGVETAAQRDRLVQLGCDELQGYLFSRPTRSPALLLPDREPPAEPIAA